MSDEEKKAIEKLKETSKQCHNSKECWKNEDCCDCYVEIEDIKAIDTVLNLIEKQEKVLNDIKQEVFNFNESLKLYDTLTNDNFRIAYVIIKKIENYLKG